MDEQLHGRELTPYPDVEAGNRVTQAKLDYNAKYAAFGSDDLHKHFKSAEKFDDQTKKSKPFYHKVGKALAKSIQSIIGDNTSKGLRDPVEAPKIGSNFKSTPPLSYSQQPQHDPNDPPASPGLRLTHGPNSTPGTSYKTPSQTPLKIESRPFGPEGAKRPVSFRPPCLDEDH